MVLRLTCVMPPSSSVKVSRIPSDSTRWRPTFDGALRRVVKVARQEKGRIRDALVPGDTVHVHDVRLPVALDHVHAIKVDPDRPAASPGDIAQLWRECEGLAQLLFLGPAWKHLLDPEELPADHIDLAIAALRGMVTLGEDGVATKLHLGEFGGSPDDFDLASRFLVGLDHERAFLKQWSELAGGRGHVGGRRRHACELEDSGLDDSVTQCRGYGVGIHDDSALLVQRSRQAEGKAAHLPQNVHIMLNADLRQVNRALKGVDDIDLRPSFRERAHYARHV